MAAEPIYAVVAVDPTGVMEPIVERADDAAAAAFRHFQLRETLQRQGRGHVQVAVAVVPDEEELGLTVAEFVDEAAQRARTRTGTSRRVLTWKPEEEDLGPAWIDVLDGDVIVSSHRVADGAWITRAEARGVAATQGCEFAEDG